MVNSIKKKKCVLSKPLLCFVILVFMAVSCHTDVDDTELLAEPFDENRHHSNLLSVEFNHETLGGFPFEYEVQRDENGYVQIGYQSFDKIARKYGFTDMVQTAKFACPDIITNDKWIGYFPNNMFRIYIENNRVIQSALNALLNDISISSANYCHKTTLDEELHYPNVLLVYLNTSFFGHIDVGYEVTKNENGIVQMGVQSFDNIATQYGFIDMKQLIMGNFDDRIYVPNWLEYCVHNNFMITIDENAQIEDALTALSTESCVVFVNYREKRSLR